MTSDPFSPLASMELVAFRRLGYQRVHFALVMPDTLVEGVVLGTPFPMIASPAVAFCGRTLRGALCCTPSANLDEWRRGKHVCRECELVATFAVARGRRAEVEQ
jgi:hypothetical protein